MRAFLHLPALALSALFAASSSLPATAQHAAQPAARTEVDLELVLAVDISRSMDVEEQALQRAGYVAAFRHPEIIDAIGKGMLGRIAVTYLEWAGDGLQFHRVPWTMIDDPESANAFATALDLAPTGRESRTSISGGLSVAADLLDSSPFTGLREVIDVSGDGPNNAGRPVLEARQAVLDRGVTINGLPIMLRPGGGFYNIHALDVYYENCVIGGPAAFLLTVESADRFATAIRRKLVLEIAGHKPEIVPATMKATGAYDCLIGEKLRRQRMLDRDWDW